MPHNLRGTEKAIGYRYPCVRKSVPGQTTMHLSFNYEQMSRKIRAKGSNSIIILKETLLTRKSCEGIKNKVHGNIKRNLQAGGYFIMSIIAGNYLFTAHPNINQANPPIKMMDHTCKL